MLTQEDDFAALAAINRELISKAEAIDSPLRAVLAQKGGRDGAVWENSLKMSQFQVPVFRATGGNGHERKPGGGRHEKSSKNCHQRSRWEYTGSTRESKMEIPAAL